MSETDMHTQQIFSPREPISRVQFAVFVAIAVGWFLLTDVVILANLSVSQSTQHILYFAVSFVPAATIAMFAEYKRLTSVRWMIRAPILVLIVVLTYTLPLLFNDLPTIVFHGIVIFLLFAASSSHDNDGASIVVRGYVYSKLKDPPTIEIASETGSRYIVKLRRGTTIRGPLGNTQDFSAIQEKEWVEASGPKLGPKTMVAHLLRADQS